MIEPPKKPGPVAKGNAKSAKTRTQEYRQRLPESGGNAISVDLDANELALLDNLKTECNLGQTATRADVIKAMAVVLNGHTYIAGRMRIKAVIKKFEDK